MNDGDDYMRPGDRLNYLIYKANELNMCEKGHDRYWACIAMYNPVMWRYNYVTGETVMVEVGNARGQG